MAENESKPERKQLEMSIWFVILLVVVIVFMCVFMSMNKKLGEAQNLYEEKEKAYNTLETKYENMKQTAFDLQDKFNSLSLDEIKAKLESMTGAAVIISTPDTVSGEVSGEIVSGEVAE